MTNRERRQRIKLLKDQLTLINRYPEEFLERLGKKGLEHFINDMLDEINFHKNFLED